MKTTWFQRFKYVYAGILLSQTTGGFGALWGAFWCATFYRDMKIMERL